MQALEGKVGRIWVLRFSDNEPLPNTIEEFADKKKLEAGIVLIIGGTKSGKLVTGPRKTVNIHKGVITTSFTEGRELLGIGTLFKNERGNFSLHMHIAAGRNTKTLTGCIRAGIKIFLIAEAIIIEIKGVKALRKKDVLSGLSLLDLHIG